MHDSKPAVNRVALYMMVKFADSAEFVKFCPEKILLTSDLVDDITLVCNYENCAANNAFEDTCSILEPRGVLLVAVMKHCTLDLKKRRRGVLL